MTPTFAEQVAQRGAGLLQRIDALETATALTPDVLAAWDRVEADVDAFEQDTAALAACIVSDPAVTEGDRFALVVAEETCAHLLLAIIRLLEHFAPGHQQARLAEIKAHTQPRLPRRH